MRSEPLQSIIGDRAVETSEGQFIGNDDVRIWLFFTSNFIDVDTFYLFWIDSVRVLAKTRNTFAVAGYTRAYINTRKLKGLDLHGTSFQPSPKINRMLITRPFAYNERLQHPTIAGLLLISDSYFFRPLSSVRLFQSNQRFQVLESRGHVSEKL